MTHNHEPVEATVSAERLAEVTRGRDEARRERDIFQRDRAALYDKLNGTPCAEIRWQQERDALRALIARAGEAIEPFEAEAKNYDVDRSGAILIEMPVFLSYIRRLAALAADLRKAGEGA